MFSDHNSIKLEINERKITHKSKRKTQKKLYFRLNENEDAAYQNV